MTKKKSKYELWKEKHSNPYIFKYRVWKKKHANPYIISKNAKLKKKKSKKTIALFGLLALVILLATSLVIAPAPYLADRDNIVTGSVAGGTIATTHADDSSYYSITEVGAPNCDYDHEIDINFTGADLSGDLVYIAVDTDAYTADMPATSISFYNFTGSVWVDSTHDLPPAEVPTIVNPPNCAGLIIGGDNTSCWNYINATGSERWVKIRFKDDNPTGDPVCDTTAIDYIQADFDACVDNDGDGFNTTATTSCGSSNEIDCDDTNSTIAPLLNGTTNTLTANREICTNTYTDTDIAIGANDLIIDGNNSVLSAGTSSVTFTTYDNISLFDLSITGIGGTTGIYLNGSLGSTIQNITISNTGTGIQLDDSSTNNTIIDNTITSGTTILLNNIDNDYQNISNNILTSTVTGIYLVGSDYHYIHDNTFNINNGDGIYGDYGGFSIYATHITVYNNDFNVNSGTASNYAIEITSGGGVPSSNWLIYNNTFDRTGGTSTVVYDEGTNMDWNNSAMGNSYFDYTGCDYDSDGIGETTYNISGTGNSTDFLPLTSTTCNDCVISIENPEVNRTYPYSINLPLDYTVSNADCVANSIWYSVYWAEGDYTYNYTDDLEKFDVDFNGNYTLTLYGTSIHGGAIENTTVDFIVDRSEFENVKPIIAGIFILVLLSAIGFIWAIGREFSKEHVGFKIFMTVVPLALVILVIQAMILSVREYLKIPSFVDTATTFSMVLIYGIIIIVFMYVMIYATIQLFMWYKKKGDERIRGT